MGKISPAKLKALIALNYRRRPRLYHHVSIAALRSSELDRLFQARYGKELPDDDAGREDVVIMLNHLAQMSGDPRRRCRSWLKARAPWIGLGDSEAMIGEIIMEPKRYKADTLAWKLRLIDRDRTALKIRTIGAIDVGKDERIQRRKDRNNELCRKRRERRKLQRKEATPV